MSKRKLNISTGQVFSHLTVISMEGKDKYGNYTYRCLCNNCGKEKVIKGTSLVSGNNRSCGCLMRTSSYVKKEEDAAPSPETTS